MGQSAGNRKDECFQDLEEKPSIDLDPAYAIPDASMNGVLKEEELDEEVNGYIEAAYTQIKEEEPDYNEYNEVTILLPLSIHSPECNNF